MLVRISSFSCKIVRIMQMTITHTHTETRLIQKLVNISEKEQIHFRATLQCHSSTARGQTIDLLGASSPIHTHTRIHSYRSIHSRPTRRGDSNGSKQSRFPTWRFCVSFIGSSEAAVSLSAIHASISSASREKSCKVWDSPRRERYSIIACRRRVQRSRTPCRRSSMPDFS